MKNHARRPRAFICFRGFSLPELLLSVSIAGTLASLAVPGFGKLVADGRRTAAVNELLATVLLARSQAAATGRNVVVCALDDANRNGALDPAEARCAGTDWSHGWFAAPWTDRDGDGRVDADELGAPLRVFVSDLPGIAVRAGGFGNAPAPPGTAVLRPFDRPSGNGTVTVCDARGAAQARALVVSASGRARISSQSADGRPLSCA